MRRFPVWVLAFALGVLAGAGFTTVADARGWPALVLVFLVLVVQALVVACVVTAIESLFPTLRSQSRRIHRA
jgi:hypothetical protein